MINIAVLYDKTQCRFVLGACTVPTLLRQFLKVRDRSLLNSGTYIQCSLFHKACILKHKTVFTLSRCNCHYYCPDALIKLLVFTNTVHLLAQTLCCGGHSIVTCVSDICMYIHTWRFDSWPYFQFQVTDCDCQFY